jgi:hypothetical protein
VQYLKGKHELRGRIFRYLMRHGDTISYHKMINPG